MDQSEVNPVCEAVSPSHWSWKGSMVFNFSNLQVGNKFPWSLVIFPRSHSKLVTEPEHELESPRF